MDRLENSTAQRNLVFHPKTFCFSSVGILITLGIIQTLLFEAMSSFRVADARGWFTFDVMPPAFRWAVFPRSSPPGACGGIHPPVRLHRLKRASKDLLPPPKSANTLALLSPLFFGLVRVLSSGLPLRAWCSFGDEQERRTFCFLENPKRHRPFCLVLPKGRFSLLLFFSITNNYGGALASSFSKPNGRQRVLVPTDGAVRTRSSVSPVFSPRFRYFRRPVHRRPAWCWVRHLPQRVRFPVWWPWSNQPSSCWPAFLRRVRLFPFIYIGPLVVEVGDWLPQGWIDALPNVLNPINGAIVVGVVDFPLVASMSEDALRAVQRIARRPGAWRDRSRPRSTMIQAPLSIIASIILALPVLWVVHGRTLAVGTVAVYTSNMFLPAQTMTAYIAQRAGGDLPFGEIGYLTIFAGSTCLSLRCV